MIIILNEAARLPRLLADLRAESFTDFEILHVDSRSDDVTVAISRRHAALFDQYHVIEIPGWGLNLGRNTGA